MARVLIGDALVNENDRLQVRINQLHDRLEATLKQALRFSAGEGDWIWPGCRGPSESNDVLRYWSLAPVCQERFQAGSIGVLGDAETRIVVRWS